MLSGGPLSPGQADAINYHMIPPGGILPPLDQYGSGVGPTQSTMFSLPKGQSALPQ